MDITDVKARVDGHISGDDILSLRSEHNDLKSSDVDTVIQTYFAGALSGKIQRIDGQTATIDKIKQLVIYSLHLTVQDFALYKSATRVEAQITFSIKDEVIQCGIKVAMPHDYSLAKSFSEIRDRPTLPIALIKLENSFITIRSGATPSSYFEATILPTGPLETVGWLLEKKVAIDGSIDFVEEFNQKLPSINLATPNLNPFKFGVFDLQLFVRVRSAVQSLPRGKPPYLFLSYVELVTEFK